MYFIHGANRIDLMLLIISRSYDLVVLHLVIDMEYESMKVDHWFEVTDVVEFNLKVWADVPV